jgi:hypothetical protein
MARDTRRAWLELAYGRETLGDLPGLRAIVDRVAAASGGAAGPAPRTGEVPPIIARADLAPRAPAAHHTASPVSMPRPAAPTASESPALRPQPAVLRSEPPALRPEPVVLRTEPAVLKPQPAVLRTEPAAQRTEPAPTRRIESMRPYAAAARSLGDRMDLPEATTRPSASQTTVVLKGASTVTHVDLGGPSDLLARAGLTPNGHKPRPITPPAARVARVARPPLDMENEIKAFVPKGNDMDAANAAATRATLLIGMRDKRANDATLDAARRLLTLGKLTAASDLLLDYIAHGFVEREAQRLLIEIDCAIGRRDTAREKCQLLSYAYRLDGRTDVAEDVERIARIL